jgi:hypothetical protein
MILSIGLGSQTMVAGENTMKNHDEGGTRGLMTQQY